MSSAGGGGQEWFQPLQRGCEVEPHINPKKPEMIEEAGKRNHSCLFDSGEGESVRQMFESLFPSVSTPTFAMKPSFESSGRHAG